MSNTIQDITGASGLNLNSSKTSATSTNSDTFMQMLALEMADEQSKTGDYAIPASTLAQIATSGGSSLESLLGEINSQLQDVSAQQAGSAAAAAYGAASETASATSFSFMGGPSRVEGTTEYYDYDVTSFINPTSTPNGSLFSGG